VDDASALNIQESIPSLVPKPEFDRAPGFQQ
jgi:hypothetical protein